MSKSWSYPWLDWKTTVNDCGDWGEQESCRVVRDWLLTGEILGINLLLLIIGTQNWIVNRKKWGFHRRCGNRTTTTSSGWFKLVQVGRTNCYWSSQWTEHTSSLHSLAKILSSLPSLGKCFHWLKLFSSYHPSISFSLEHVGIIPEIVIDLERITTNLMYGNLNFVSDVFFFGFWNGRWGYRWLPLA